MSGDVTVQGERRAEAIELLYVGSYTSESAGQGTGITVLRRDGSRLDRLERMFTPSPSYLVADPERPVLYAVNELSDGAVSSYAIGWDGGLRWLSSRLTAGVWPCHLALHAGHLLAANYGTGSVSVHPIGPDGSLGEHSDLAEHTGRGPHPTRQEGPHAHQVMLGPDDDVTVVDLGLDRLVHYRLDGGRLTRIADSILPPGCGPRHAVAHSSGRWYMAAELDSTVLTLERDHVTGRWIGSATCPATESVPSEGNYPSAIRLSADGRHLYLANRGANTIGTFRIDNDGTATMVGEVGCGGEWPRDLAVVGGVIFVANQRSHNVVAFRIDTESGLPQPTGDMVETGSPSCLLAYRLRT